MTSYELNLGKNVKTIIDKKSNSRVVNFPFEFPDGTRGILIVCRLKNEDWIPDKDIKNVTINFQ